MPEMRKPRVRPKPGDHNTDNRGRIDNIPAFDKTKMQKTVVFIVIFMADILSGPPRAMSVNMNVKQNLTGIGNYRIAQGTNADTLKTGFFRLRWLASLGKA